jgi:uncharacterized protein
MNVLHFFNPYFWRTYNQKEIDFIEESGGSIKAFEFKINLGKKFNPPENFMSTYPVSGFSVVNQDNFLEELFIV